MEPLDLLTIIGLIVAVYAILPKERLLDLRLRLNWIDWVAILLSVILLHYITFYPIFKSLNIAPDLGTWRWGFNPENISYLIILLTALFVWLHSRRARVRRSSILKFRELTERLLMEGKYSDLLFLLELHHNSLFKIYNLDFPISHIRNRLDPNSFGQAFISVHTKDFSSKLLGLLPMSLRKLLANFLPSWQKESEAAQDIVHRLLLSSSFISYLCEARPYFVLDLLKHQFHEKNGFLNLYVRGLLSNAHSVLYFEIQENQNLSSYSRYIIDEKNRFIHFFLADAEVANKAAIWKPFGDFTLERLDELWIDPNTDTYNQPIGTYRETDQWYCPIHATIQFFDIMIHEALFQGIT